MKKRFILILIIIFVLILSIGYRSINIKGNVRNAKITIGESDIYSKEEIQDAINIVLERFESFPAKLIRLWYDEEKSLEESEDWKIQYDAHEAIVLYSDFKTYIGNQAINQGFNSNQEYKNWKWILTKNNNESWELKTMGY